MKVRLAAFAFLLFSILISAPALAASTSVIRDLPVEVNLNSQFTSYINIGINEGDAPAAVGIEETLPSGWQLVSVNTTYAKADASTNTFYWLFGPASLGLPHVSDATIKLTIMPTTSSGSFSGSWYADDDEGAISGDNTTMVNQPEGGGGGGGGSGGGSTGGGGFSAGISGTFCLSGQTKPCGSSIGECRSGTRSCLNSVWSVQCSGEVAPAAELCDHLDNDCNGEADNGIACECFITDRRSCGSEIGACKPGRLSCDAGKWGSCSGAVGPFEEICGNGIDDDCDGVVDEADCISPANESCRDGAIDSACLCGGHTFTAGYCYGDVYSDNPAPSILWLSLIISGLGVSLLGLAVYLNKKRKHSRLGKLQGKYNAALT